MKEKNVTFKSFDGTALDGILTLPENTINKCIILVHGITSNLNEWGFYKDAAPFFASKGITTFRFNYRHHFTDEANTNLESLSLSGIINDIDAASDLLKNTKETENSDYFILGTSFGGGLCMYWSNHFSFPIKKIFLAAPVLNYEDDILNRESFLDDTKKLILKEQNNLNSNGFIKSDGIQFGRYLINEIPIIDREMQTSIETIIFHGDKDSNVPHESSVNFAKNSDNCTLISIKDADHGFAAEGDEELTSLVTKENHKLVYSHIIDNIL